MELAPGVAVGPYVIGDRLGAGGMGVVYRARDTRLQRDVAITDKITDATTGSTLIVRWGQRGRVGTAAIKPRARLLAQRLAPWFDVNEIDNLPAPLPMRAGGPQKPQPRLT